MSFAFNIPMKVEKARSRPYDAEVEWLQFGDKIRNAHSYILTGLIPSLDDEIEVVFSDCTISTQSCYYGTTGSSWRNKALGYYNGEFWCGDKYMSGFHRTEATSLYSGRKLYHNGVEVADFAAASGEPYRQLVLGGMLDARGDTAAYFFKGRMHGFTVRRGGIDILNYIPVRKDGVGYMFDRVSGTLVPNDGPEPFVIGPDKN